jgi:fluoride exporter
VSLGLWLGVGVAGGAGAVARVLLDAAVAARVGRRFPAGTLVVNVSGTLLYGLLIGLALDRPGFRVLGTGLLAAFTTFSTWALESDRLGERGRSDLAALNLGGALALGLAAAWTGRALGEAL